MGEEKEQTKNLKNVANKEADASVHDICHSMNKDMPEPSGLVSKFEESLERFAAVDAKEFLDEIIKITDEK